MKKIKDIGAKRIILSKIFKARNGAVSALDHDNEEAYRIAIVELYNLVHKLEMA